MAVALGPAILAWGIALSCESTPAPTATPSPEPTSTSQPTPSPTPTPFPEPTPTSRVTATPVPAPSTPAPTPTPTVGGRYGGTLNLASRENIAHQDVHQEASPALSTWGPGVAYSRLLRFKAGPDVEHPSLAVECELCESWTMEDQRTFVFGLRRGVQWQDIEPVDGRELTADDVVFSYDRQRQKDWPNAALLGAVGEVEAVSPDKVRITLAVPDADFMVSIADGRSKIVAREAVELNGHLRNGPTIGTGPWVLTQTRPNLSHAFEANPSYFEEGLPFVSNLNIYIITDGPTREAAFRVRVLDVHQMEPREWREFQQQHSQAQSLLFQEAGVGLEVGLKTSRPPFDDVRVRRAAFQAMDPWGAIEEVWLGSAYVSLGFPVADAGWLLEEDELRGFFGRPEVARDLLREAGVDLSVPVGIKVGDFGDQYIAHARRIADEMTAVGFRTTVDVINRRAFGEEVWLGGDYQVFVGPPPPVATPNGYLLPVLHSRGFWNTTEHGDDELDRLLEAQAREFDGGRRKELLLEVQRRALDGAYRFMPATRVSIWAWWPRVRNFHPNFAGLEYSHWSRVWLEE